MLEELRLNLKISRRFPEEQKAKERPGTLVIPMGTENRILEIRPKRGNKESAPSMDHHRGHMHWRQEERKRASTDWTASVGTETFHFRFTAALPSHPHHAVWSNWHYPWSHAHLPHSHIRALSRPFKRREWPFRPEAWAMNYIRSVETDLWGLGEEHQGEKALLALDCQLWSSHLFESKEGYSNCHNSTKNVFMFSIKFPNILQNRENDHLLTDDQVNFRFRKLHTWVPAEWQC